MSNNKIVFLRGRKVTLRSLDKETDLASCQRWVNDAEVRHYLKRYMPVSRQAEEEWFDGLAKKPNDLVFAIETLEGKFIGTMGLLGIHWKDRFATSGAMIGEKDYWGKGYGTDAKMALLDYAFNALNLRKVCSTVISYNKRSLRCLLRCGYKIEGRRKNQFFKDGRYWDEVVLAVFKKDWLPIWRKYQEIYNVR